MRLTEEHGTGVFLCRWFSEFLGRASGFFMRHGSLPSMCRQSSLRTRRLGTIFERRSALCANPSYGKTTHFILRCVVYKKRRFRKLIPIHTATITPYARGVWEKKSISRPFSGRGGTWKNNASQHNALFKKMAVQEVSCFIPPRYLPTHKAYGRKSCPDIGATVILASSGLADEIEEKVLPVAARNSGGIVT